MRAKRVLQVDDAKDGWLHINGATVIPLDESPVAPVTGVGWVLGKLISVDPQSDSYGKTGGGLYLYSEPHARSKKLHKILEGSISLGITDCGGGWIKVEIRYLEDKTKRTYVRKLSTFPKAILE
jgi:hypothetical protein